MPARDLVLEDALHYRSCWEEAEIEQVLATLKRLDDRLSGSVRQQREHQRKTYIAPVMVALRHKGKRSSRAVLTVVARDLSRSGIGFLAPLFFEPEFDINDATMIRGDSVFREGAVLDLGLKKADGELLWLYGTVLRLCTVQHDYLDVGVRFNGRRNLALDFDFI
jgi:hypothetical protein